MLEHLLSVLSEILSWTSLFYLFLGTMLGMLFGILPGLGGPQVMALLLPLTFAMEPAHAVIFLIGAAGAVPTGGSLTSILMNTPGTGQNAATMFDGFPLAKQGKAGMAIGAASFASVLGGIFGAVILTLILPIGKHIVLAFSYPEYFMMALMGLAMIASLSEGALWKALIAAGLGLMLSFFGTDPVTGVDRFTFGTFYLADGVKLVPALIGLFAIAETVSMFKKKGAISNEKVNTSLKGVLSGITSVFKHFGVFLKSSVIGTLIGIIPGVGGAVANFLAYGQAAATKKNPENFGKGDIRGVIAPEAANNAKDGGALVPTLIFGIPGSLEMAILMGALMIHGIQPGPRLMMDNPDIVVTLIYTLVLANIIAGIFTLLAAAPLARLTSVKTTYIAPIVMMLSLVGAYATEGMIGDVIVALVFGLLGYAMQQYGFSRVALIIALVLGDLMQKSFHQTVALMGPEGFFVRPLSLGLFLLTVFILLFPSIRKAKKRGDAHVQRPESV
ncbi:tripartite tricarboxylate transporter permease [Bacillaceae bacterium]